MVFCEDMDMESEDDLLHDLGPVTNCSITFSF